MIVIDLSRGIPAPRFTEDAIDVEAFEQMLTPYAAEFVLTDKPLLRDMRTQLSQTGAVLLYRTESVDGTDHEFTLRDLS